jgi:hypothetical protein
VFKIILALLNPYFIPIANVLLFLLFAVLLRILGAVLFAIVVLTIPAIASICVSFLYPSKVFRRQWLPLTANCALSLALNHNQWAAWGLSKSDSTAGFTASKFLTGVKIGNVKVLPTITTYLHNRKGFVKHLTPRNVNSHVVCSQGGTSAAFSVANLDYLPIIPRSGGKC